MQHRLDEFSGVQFGTSGLRGLVSDLSDIACYAYARAFLQYCLQWEQEPENRSYGELAAPPSGEDDMPRLADRKVAVSGDLRRSTSRIIRAVYRAVIDMGMTPLDCGRFPTPTLALFAMSCGIPGIMVTGSHIPDDRNGIKFFLPDGEITKRDERQIREQAVEISDDMFSEDGRMHEMLFPRWVETDRGDAAQGYYSRYVDAFPHGLLDGMRFGLYEHSAVGSELLGDLYESLGAEVLRLGRSAEFVPIDTESLPPDVPRKAAIWAATCELDAILSTDGDSDRPLMFDENGNWICGDVLAILTARLLDAQTVVTPVTTAGILERTGFFPKVVRTKVGSPYVIEAMRQAIAAGYDRVVGFEANGGFLVGTPFSMHWLAEELRLPVPKTAAIAPLPTRDPALVHIAVPTLAKLRGMSLSQLVASLPPCHKLSDRITDYPNGISSQMLAQLAALEGSDFSAIQKTFGELFDADDFPVSVDLQDGLRMTFGRGDIIHLRASGNAPEFRCYVEASSGERSRELLDFALARMRAFRESPSR